ncbi:MAG TPA: heparan-alpha-glucosaminide N-acetyltransferase domain-containing protein [Spirochaetota bacterium]|nr:heparan-alpha-glucosaminide N-acetyltransferase domain-containing protein [Spirochaetota bacterium]
MKKTRLNFVDLMRGLAMIVMIEVHVVNSLMNPALRNETWFYFVNFINGMVAPSFVFISGFAFMLGSRSKLAEFRTFKYAFWKQLGRIMLIWFLGYMLHIPFFSKYKCINIATTDHWMNFLGVDVLQCIAIGLLLIFILRLAIKSDKVFIAAVILLGLGAVIPAAKIYTIDFQQHLPLFMAMYITPIYYTNFPVFPWFGFMAAGILTAWFFMKSREKGSEHLFIKRLLISGTLLAVTAIPLMFYLMIPDVRPNILFFAGRLGVVFIILTGCYYYCAWRDELSPIILYPSRESLAVYFMHLQFLHREVWWGKSIITMSGQSLGFVTCLIISAGVVLLMLPMARVWNYYKTKYNYFGRIAVAVMFTVGGIVFMMR